MVRDEHWITIQEAARRLGVKDDAVRKRIQRGTLRSEKDLEDGRVYVYLDAAHDATHATTYDATHATIYDAAEDAARDAVVVLVKEMRDRIASLERMLDEEREARTEEQRRHDTLMATLMQRLPELEAPTDQRGPTKTVFEDSGNGVGKEPVERRSWWRKFFGFE